MPRRSRQKTDDEGRNKPNRLSYMLPKKRFETINAAAWTLVPTAAFNASYRII